MEDGIRRDRQQIVIPLFRDSTGMELIDLYDRERRPLGKTIVRGETLPEGTYRIVVHVIIIDNDGRMLIQRRHPEKDSWPGAWDVTVGGWVDSGETSLQAGERELMEELGINLSLGNERPVMTMNAGPVFDDYYVVTVDHDIGPLHLQESEVVDAMWADRDTIVEKIEDGSFIPYKVAFIDLLLSYKDYRGYRTSKDAKGND